MKGIQKTLYGTGLLLLLSGISACKVSDDALAAAQQTTSTSAALSAYYGAVSDTLIDTVALNELNQSIFGIPFEAADREQIEQARAEINRRRDLATALATLSSSLNALTGFNASANIAASATSLGHEMVSVKALPKGSPVPDGLGSAGTFILQIVQQHEEKKAAKAMDSTLAALVELFGREQPVYDSLARQRIFLSKAVASALIKRQAVDPTPMLQPALQPFGLVSLPPDAKLQTTLRDLADARLTSSSEVAGDRAADASTAMLTALQEMSSRIHLLATEKPMAIRGNPFSLKIVESWAASMI